MSSSTAWGFQRGHDENHSELRRRHRHELPARSPQASCHHSHGPPETFSLFKQEDFRGHNFFQGSAGRELCTTAHPMVKQGGRSPWPGAVSQPCWWRSELQAAPPCGPAPWCRSTGASSAVPCHQSDGPAQLRDNPLWSQIIPMHYKVAECLL